MKKIIIGKSYVKGNKLISNIEYENKKYEMYYEVEPEYKEFLCCEMEDAFLVALIPFIIKHEYDIIVEGKISLKLYYQLTNYLIPLLCKEFKKRRISITCETTDICFSPKGVGASISCGVDSFYTLLKHKEQNINEYNITHLTFFNAGSHGQYGGENARNLYYKRLEHIKKFCQEQKYNLVTVDSNMNELIMMNHEKTHTFRTLGCVFALQKLFGKYYFASGLEFNGSHIDEGDTAYYDILNVHCLSNENINFYCSGLETSRLNKMKYISNYPETYEWLNVCVRTDWVNCGVCEKCIRTMTALESINKLERYSKVFDLNNYKKNKLKIYSSMLRSRSNKITKSLYVEIINSFNENKIKIPILAYILSVLPTKYDIKTFIKLLLPKKILNKVKRNKKIYIKDGWTD